MRALNRFKSRDRQCCFVSARWPAGLGDGAGCPHRIWPVRMLSIVITQIPKPGSLHQITASHGSMSLVERVPRRRTCSVRLLAAERKKCHARSLLSCHPAGSSRCIRRRHVNPDDRWKPFCVLPQRAQICSPLPFFRAQVGSCVTLTSPQSCPQFPQVCLFVTAD